MHIFCDFDWTISLKDTTDEILSRFALPEWEVIEAAWKRGEIASAECMQKQIALIRANLSQLNAELDLQDIDPDFYSFYSFCKSGNIPLTIISDGVDYFIKRILSRNELDDLPIIANTFVINESGGYSLTSNYTNPDCKFGFGVCKCRQISSAKGLKVFIGDGRSDFCAVHVADIVFAKGTLAEYCNQQNIAYSNYDNFAQILQAIKANPVVDGLTQNINATYSNPGEYHAEYA